MEAVSADALRQPRAGPNLQPSRIALPSRIGCGRFSIWRGWRCEPRERWPRGPPLGRSAERLRARAASSTCNSATAAAPPICWFLRRGRVPYACAGNDSGCAEVLSGDKSACGGPGGGLATPTPGLLPPAEGLGRRQPGSDKPRHRSFFHAEPPNRPVLLARRQLSQHPIRGCETTCRLVPRKRKLFVPALCTADATRPAMTVDSGAAGRR